MHDAFDPDSDTDADPGKEEIADGEQGKIMTLKHILLVMLGGGLGAASRYTISLVSAKCWGVNFPWGTLVVNLAGCFLIGLLFALAERSRLLGPDLRLLLITGYLGALTTFSTFALETVNSGFPLMTLRPFINILANNVGGLSLTLFGLWLGGLIK
ncbi:MAG: fluoride efflux transporter CrcB [Desulfatiglandaceae bacterium]